MKKQFLFVILIFSSLMLQGQSTPDSTLIVKRSIYAEAGTIIAISLVSLNYESHFKTSKNGKFHLYSRKGVGFGGLLYGPAGFGANGGITVLMGKRNHYLEASAGALLGYDWGLGFGDGFFLLPILDIGYRFQPKNGVVLKVKGGASGIGFGLGYSF